MDPKRLTGPNAGSIKYDLITALSVTGLSGKPVVQTSMIRLVALITARYNWFRDELTVGQRDIAKMWSVNERTVKREMKRLVDAKVLLKVRHGVRGRVAAYRLNYREIINLSRSSWANVGPDFVERMSSIYPESQVKVVKVDFTTRKLDADPEKPETGDRGKWRAVRGMLREANPDVFRNWYDNLVFKHFSDGVVHLEAPNSFTANYIRTHLGISLLAVSRSVFEEVVSLQIEARG